MNLKKTFSGAAAGVLALALAASGATVANAAEGDIIKPQPNDSNGAFFLYDGDGEFVDSAVDEDGNVILGDPDRIYDRSEVLLASASSTDVLAEIMPADYLLPGQNFNQVWKFVTKPGTEYVDAAQGGLGGTNTWRAFGNSAAAGPNGGVWTDNWTLEEKVDGNNGGIESVFTQGGDWSVGIAFTEGYGVQVRGAVWRTVHIEPGTGKFTIDPVVVEGADGTPPPPVWRELDSNDPNFEQLFLDAFQQQQDAMTSFVTNAQGGVLDQDVKTVEIDLGAGYANQTLEAGAFSSYTDLGLVQLDGNGQGSVNVGGLGNGVHTLVLSIPGGDPVVFGSITLNLVETVMNEDILVTITNTGDFKIVADAPQNVDFGSIQRGQSAAAQQLGAFTVTDDRAVRNGWTVNASATNFERVGNPALTFGNLALGYEPQIAGGAAAPAGITLGAPKLAGEGAFGVFASAGANDEASMVGTKFDAGLSFKAPVDVPELGQYKSTFTLTLVG